MNIICQFGWNEWMYDSLGGPLVKKSKKYVSKNIGCNILVVG